MGDDTLLNRSKKKVDIKKLIDSKGNTINTPSEVAEN